MLWEITFLSGVSSPVKFTDQLVHRHWSLMTTMTDRSLSADVPFKPTTHVKLHPGSTCQSKQPFQSPAPAGQECEDWKIVLSLRYSEGCPLILISSRGQHFSKCTNCMWRAGWGGTTPTCLQHRRCFMSHLLSGVKPRLDAPTICNNN